jgi:ATP-dependent Lhr-like helicase
VVTVDGEPAAYLERGGRSLLTFPAAAGHPGWADGLAALVKDGMLRKVELVRIDGLAARDASEVATRLRAAGFADSYRGLVVRAF